jgi:hypothetical protein
VKGYIAFCPHFHQPHFQLYKTREEAFVNSYQPWLELLQEAVGLDKFFINLHFSGPFLYWFRQQKPSYLRDFKDLLATKKIGLVGGLADEPFIQLSSRIDDCLYQLKEYDELCRELFDVKARDWQGIHLVERECGEYLLRHITQAACLLGAPPVYYLDAETFYQPHFSRPGGLYDYCLKHFGFKDPVALTTIAHIPDEMLYFGLQDEIGGQIFKALPVHTQFRYQLLKRDAFTADDRVQIKPAHYYFYIKDTLEQAHRLARQYGREIDPMLVIFEDAEKMGQWSKDPQGDKQWLMEFFRLVVDDPDLEFIGLQDYISRVGILDTYPVSSSHSYPEWENWTAKRGIRGVTYGDERLRRVISRLRLFEKRQEAFEHHMVAAALSNQAPTGLEDMQIRAIMSSLERYAFVNQILQDGYPQDYCGYYRIINRIRNLVYQEDPKWASRHPSYGSSPYYDMQGLAYLEIADRLLHQMMREINPGDDENKYVNLLDWDFDGQDEIVLFNSRQSLAIDQEGGCINYHFVLADDPADHQSLAALLRQNFSGLDAYHSVYRYAYPLIMTETDSSLKAEIFAEGARRENCRNSLRCSLMIENNEVLSEIGDFDRSFYELEGFSEDSGCCRVVLSCTKNIIVNAQAGIIKLSKEYLLKENSISLTIKAELGNAAPGNYYLVPQVVSSAAPSDEIDFHPVSWLELPEGEGKRKVSVHHAVQWNQQEMVFVNKAYSVSNLDQVDYVFMIKTGHGDQFSNRIRYQFSGNRIEKMEVRPAVEYYYKDLVFDSQSKLGYQSSGLMLMPYIPCKDGSAEFTVDINWQLDYDQDLANNQQRLYLIEKF